MNTSMDRSLTASVSPQGRLFLEMTDDELVKPIEPALSRLLLNAFDKSTSTGLTLLASTQLEKGLNAPLDFWRRFAESYFQALCRSASQDSKQWCSPQPPSSDELQERIDASPAIRGIEYLIVQSLTRIWNELDAHTHQAVKNSDDKDLANYLHQLNEAWNLVGRVTFHLAENKKNPGLPFAFLATYTDGRSNTGTIRHVPLADALKHSIAGRDTERLNLLLEPVQRASEKSELIRNLLESRQLFSPQAWSIHQAFQFLSSVPLMEQSGVIVRVPNWWNASRPPRPSIQVRIGNKKKSGIGMAEALDFNVQIAFQGEPLTKEELNQLMAAREGMTLLRGQWVQVDEKRLNSALKQWEVLRSQHASGIGFLEGLRLLSGVSIGDTMVDDQVRQWSHVEAGDWLREILDTLRDPSGAVQIDPQQGLKAKLRNYQADGVRWLWFTTQLGLGACLADDMGLGKTIQVISLLLQYKQSKNKKDDSPALPSLLIAPTSLLDNWQREIERFAPGLKMFIAHRSHHGPPR